MAQMRLARYGGGYIWCIRNGVVDSRFTYTSTALATADGLGWNNLCSSSTIYDIFYFSPITNMKWNSKSIINKYKKCYVKFKVFSTSYYAQSVSTIAFKYRQTGSLNDLWASGTYLTRNTWNEFEATFLTQNMSISNDGFYHYLWGSSEQYSYKFYITELKFYN